MPVGIKNTLTAEPVAIPAGTDMLRYAIKQAQERQLDKIAILNVSVVQHMVDRWKKNLSFFSAHYAVKCNPHPMIMKVIAENGFGFDCASPVEIDAALAAGASPKDIIYANPNKPPASIQYSFKVGVDTFTFDTENELRSMITNTPAGRRGNYVLRLLPPDESHSLSKFGIKFGTNEEESTRLIHMCKELGGELVGFSFHVGSGCGSAYSYKAAVDYIGAMAKYAKEHCGFQNLYIIDIGGGFVTERAETHFSRANKAQGIVPPTFEETTTILRTEVQQIIHEFKNPNVIAEPGRFFASDCVTLAMRIFGRRLVFEHDGSDRPDNCFSEKDIIKAGIKIKQVKYIVPDGIFGVFNYMLHGYVHPDYKFFKANGEAIPYDRDQENVPGNVDSLIFGPTCASVDCILKDTKIPLLEVGDWIVVDAYGAYSFSGVTEFNGIMTMPILPVVEK